MFSTDSSAEKLFVFENCGTAQWGHLTGRRSPASGARLGPSGASAGCRWCFIDIQNSERSIMLAVRSREGTTYGALGLSVCTFACMSAAKPPSSPRFARRRQLVWETYRIQSSAAFCCGRQKPRGTINLAYGSPGAVGRFTATLGGCSWGVGTSWAGPAIKMGHMPLEWTHCGIMLYNFSLL